MRNALFAFVLAAPMAASAQTPRDIAHFLWPQGAPATVATAPEPGSASAGAVSARDVARQVWAQGAPLESSRAPGADTVYARSFTGADLDRLRGAADVSLAAAPAASPYRIVAKDAPHG